MDTIAVLSDLLIYNIIRLMRLRIEFVLQKLNVALTGTCYTLLVKFLYM
jgi:hypothetical protein